VDDVFTIQDEVVHTIVASLEGRLVTRIAEQARRKPTHSMLAYECVLQAREHFATFDAAKAEPLARRAIELDPRYAQASAWLARVYLAKYFFDPTLGLLDEALIHAKAAVALDEQDATCHSALGQIYLFRREFDLAGLHYERALALNPNDVTVITARASWLTRIGRVSEALAELDKALRRDPFPPNWYWEVCSLALLRARRFAETIECVKRMTQKFSWSHADLAACYAHLGQMDEARAEAAEVLRMQPNFTISWLLKEEPDKNPADAEPLVQGMRLAGLPE
jgi:tetratricopeptide (TPR) repeat protein